MSGRFADPGRSSCRGRFGAAGRVVVVAGILAGLAGTAAAEPEVAPQPREVTPPPPVVASPGQGERPAPDPASFAEAGDKFAIDRDRVIFKHIQDDSFVRGEEANSEEYEAWNQVLLFAHQFSAADLEKAARRDVTFRDLFEEIRQDYKLKLVYFEGRLIRVRRAEATKRMKEGGVHALYEGWVVPLKEPNGNPVCVLFTELPAELAARKPEDLMNINRWVGFAGYSFKLMRYESAEKDPKDPRRFVVKRAPLLMARSVTMIEEPDGPDVSFGGTFAPAVLMGLGGMLVLTLGLTWWFHRGDRVAKREIEAVRGNPFVAPPPGPPADGRGWVADD